MRGDLNEQSDKGAPFPDQEGMLQCSLRGHKFNSPLLAYVPVLLFCVLEIFVVAIVALENCLL